MVTGASRERGKLHAPVVDDFERRILGGELSIGDRLPSEAEIAKLYNVSTRSVREAMQILETKGLIRRKHGERALVVRDDVGEFFGSLAATVRQLFANNSDYLVQLLDVRRIIETEVVKRLSAGERPILPGVAEALARMRAAAAAGDQSGFIDGDAAFHLGLVRSLGNDILDVVYDNLFAIIIDVIRVTSRVPDKPLAAAFAEHEEMLHLIATGQGEAAATAIDRQIDNTSRYLKIALDNAALDRKA